MEAVMGFLRWYQDHASDLGRFIFFICFLFALYAVFSVLSFLCRVIIAIFRSGSKQKGKSERLLSPAEIARREYGIVEPGLKVFIFSIITGECVEIKEDRFYSSEELSPEKFKQIKSLNLSHAKHKFLQWLNQ